MNRALFPAFVLALPALAACQDEQRPQLTDKEFAEMAEAAPVAPPEDPEAEPVAMDTKSELYEFHYTYPKEAAAIAVLNERLGEQGRAAEKELRDMARKEAEARRTQNIPFNGLYSNTAFETLGNTPDFLSLVATVETYTGGAHPNHGTSALLWDRKAEKPVDVAVLFGTADNRDAALRGDFCAKLEADRRRRLGEVPHSDIFGECPDLDSVTIAPADRDGDGLFDAFRLIADPYVAGAYAEGSYEFDLPATARRVTLIAERYRDSFEQ